jgi:integrase
VMGVAASGMASLHDQRARGRSRSRTHCSAFGKEILFVRLSVSNQGQIAAKWQEQTPYAETTDWVFASTRLKGKQPRVANMLVEDHLRPAALKAGVLKEGEKVRFGFHNLRHSLASFLVRKGTDVKTVQKLLRHSDVATTLGIYAHSTSEDRLAAQDDMLAAMMTPSNAVN